MNRIRGDDSIPSPAPRCRDDRTNLFATFFLGVAPIIRLNRVIRGQLTFPIS